MSEILQSILLGIIQGLTEFLPVSSSGHIELTKFFLGFEPENDLLFTVVVHFATASSTVVVFRKDIAKVFTGLFQFKNNESFRFSWYIVLSMIPAVFVGLFFDEFIESLFEEQVVLVICCLLFTAGLLVLADKAKTTSKKVGWKEAIIIGVAQAIAILPGISRSGATISTSVLLKIDRTEAARFSFLMVVPLIFGKMAKDILDGALTDPSLSIIPLIAGFSAAFLVGIFACNLMIKLVVNANLKYFSVYLVIVSIIALVWYLTV